MTPSPEHEVLTQALLHLPAHGEVQTPRQFEQVFEDVALATRTLPTADLPEHASAWQRKKRKKAGVWKVAISPNAKGTFWNFDVLSCN